MDLQSTSGGIEDNVGIPDDLRCKRSDGKQWRCTAMSMPDKTVCEKHYIQAKKRAANSTTRANMKKAKRNSLGESDIYLESKSDDMDIPPVNGKLGNYSGSTSGKKYKDRAPKSQISYSPETPSVRSFSGRSSVKLNDDIQRNGEQYEQSRQSYRTPPPPNTGSSKGRYQKMFDSSPTADTSEGSSESSDDTDGQPCHQCRRNDRDRVIWCLKCERRGYCESCISTWYSDVPLEEIQKVCPACRGNCCCKLCLRADNLIKARIREISAQDKLQYLYSLLSAVLPVVKQIHYDQCSEVELEKKIQGNQIDLVRTKLNADEQMCCDFCRIPIIDYHRHCPNCSYDLCLSCCKDIREASDVAIKEDVEEQIVERNDDIESVSKQMGLSDFHLNSFKKFSSWRSNIDGSIPCPPKEYKGCGTSVLTLRRIFKMNWVTKLVKNVEEMVSGCKICDLASLEKSGCDFRLFQAAHRENSEDNFLYRPSSQHIKNGGIMDFRKHWGRGEPVIIKEVCDISAMAIWDPMVIWRGVRETEEEKTKGDSRTVKAIDCFNWSEVNIELGEFIRGYGECSARGNGSPRMLKLKDWPSPSASEEFLMYQRPDFISKLPLLEFIHSKWGLLNVAAKLPHYSLQNDVGPKIFISYGTYEELGKGDSVNNIHVNMRDMVFVLVHTCEVKLEESQKTEIEKMKEPVAESDAREMSENLKEGESSNISSRENRHNKSDASLNIVNDLVMPDEHFQGTSQVEDKAINCNDLNKISGQTLEKIRPGALWDIFRRQDVPKLLEYLKVHWKELVKATNGTFVSVSHALYSGVIYLNEHQKRKLKEEFGVEPWSIEQHFGEAIFIPAGCPCQVRNLQSTVQLGLDFLSPESLGEAARLAEEFRGLPNDHDVKLQMLEVGKISLYASSSSIKEVRKLILDPKMGPELGFEDPNLTALVSENLEKMVKQKQIACA